MSDASAMPEPSGLQDAEGRENASEGHSELQDAMPANDSDVASSSSTSEDSTDHISFEQDEQDFSDITFDEMYRLTQFAMSNHNKAEESHSQLLQSLSDGQPDLDLLRSALESNASSLQQTRRFLKICLASVPFQFRSSIASAAAATKVLSTAELFEHILLYLEPRDILSTIQITKSASSLFLDSSELQTKLGLRLDNTGFIYSAFSECQGCEDDHCSTSFDNFGVMYKTIPTHHDPSWDANGNPLPKTYRVRIQASFTRIDSLPKIGSRCRSMLICQPPVRVMQVLLSCCSSRQHHSGGVRSDNPRRWAAGCQPPNTTVTYGEADEHLHLDAAAIAANDVVRTLEVKSATGLTVGDLHDATLALRAAHALCPHAAYGDHAADGRVHPDVTFHSDRTLQQDDPHVFAEVQAQADEELRNLGERAARQAFDIYIRAKAIYFENGWKIPTFEEFKLRHPCEM